MPKANTQIHKLALNLLVLQNDLDYFSEIMKEESMIDKRLRKTIRSTVPLLGGMAMGAMAFFGASHSAQGTTIVAGSDYVYTPADQSSLFEWALLLM
ncbi:hypothetical protein [Crocosphaera sp.]|uniref:hypothetical protein n=1 Tax=Crocosphaera sp. TaxID=2729996 RepID=UPI00257BF877|nr:hypothetical protein [Crocosphaera sp.]NQZ65282.1 hypothetical protein [Crocosphaera sp.]